MKPPEWCEKAARRFNSCADKDCPDCALAAAIIAEEHEKGCEFVHGEAEALRKLADIKQAVRELVEAAGLARRELLLLKGAIHLRAVQRLESALAKVEELL